MTDAIAIWLSGFCSGLALGLALQNIVLRRAVRREAQLFRRCCGETINPPPSDP